MIFTDEANETQMIIYGQSYTGRGKPGTPVFLPQCWDSDQAQNR